MKEQSLKTGIAGTIKTSLEKVPGIVHAFFAGSEKDLENPGKEIEIIVIEGPDLEEMKGAITEVEKQLGRTIRVSSFTVNGVPRQDQGKERFRIFPYL